MSASEAFRMICLIESIAAFANNLITTLMTSVRHEVGKVVFAVEFAALFDEANVVQVGAATRSRANEMVRAPNLANSADERTANDLMTRSARWHFRVRRWCVIIRGWASVSAVHLILWWWSILLHWWRWWWLVNWPF